MSEQIEPLTPAAIANSKCSITLSQKRHHTKDLLYFNSFITMYVWLPITTTTKNQNHKTY
jgi:hypothetical protein